MINGEKIAETASPDPSIPFDPKSDGVGDGGDCYGDVSPRSPPSRYSSFGESEYERYCSANSMMGTPSMCSTITVFNDFPEPEFGSLKSLGLGEGSGGLDNFSLGGRIERNREDRRCLSSGRIEFGKEDGNIGGRRRASYGSSGLELYGNEDAGGADDVNELMSWKLESGSSGLGGVSDVKYGSDNSDEDSEKGMEVWRGVVGNDNIGVEGVAAQETNDSNGEGIRNQFVPEVEEFDGGEMDREEGTSSRNEYSEDEGSMYNYGSDDERKSGFSQQRNVHYYRQEKPQNENPFLINSSVAFGSDDWDDFMQESGGSNLDSFTRNVFEGRRGRNVETKRKISNSTSITSVEHQNACQTEQGNDVKDVQPGCKQVQADDKLVENVYSSMKLASSPSFLETDRVVDVKDIPVASYQVQAIDDSVEFTKSSFTIPFQNVQEPEVKDSRDMLFTKNQAPGPDKSAKHNKASLVGNALNIQPDPQAKESPDKKGLSILDDGVSDVHTYMNTGEVIDIDHGQDLEKKKLGTLKVKLDPLSDQSTNQISIHSTRTSGNVETDFLEDHKPSTLPSIFENNTTKSSASEDILEEHPMPVKTDNFEHNEFYDEVVDEMEEILLDSAESPGARFTHGNSFLQSQQSLPVRDGGSTASTSGTDDAHLFHQHSLRIDGVEVVGARQKKGDVSFSERLVGVKEYTVYQIRVLSGEDHWEVERRYRDFFTLYRRLKTVFSDHGWDLPSPWSAVEKESRKIFGNASPDVIAERSVLIQECLQSVLHFRFFSSPPSALVWFLSPQDSAPSSLESSYTPASLTRRADTQNISTWGKTISLIVEIRQSKSLKQMLEAQHYTCAGCHKHFDDGKTLIRDFAQTLGWGKPRLCEYTGQLFCSLCHTNEIAIIPARVLHNWDFTQYPVSQFAKSYLDSIHDQPMLCVSAVNPFLFSKVPAMLHVMGVRKKIGTILPYVRCPFRRSINKGLGSRRYLLEGNDFFALRDLIDLSKGAFAVLPVIVETVSRKILDHITEQCLICCDVGVPCGARQACNDPSSLIFPFQEDEIERCPSCASVFHKPCFRKIMECTCGAHLREDEPAQLIRRATSGVGAEISGFLDLFGGGSGSGLLSGLFSKAKPEKPREHKASDNVILMGSLPSTSL
ncbi:hypothetical protein D8674_029594 [Pyrus ussuriensis x Pyrus communis]|uniref:PX domain-containing protein n=1 Tax=Pyrus ussuriensis x Pyrus communis TaxID=2448454 RepID=A0A5N5I2H8_9ROSA|nr:hypothetical protein D8674_029594 [Pyrus ussuriensis x Pyrus communis]